MDPHAGCKLTWRFSTAVGLCDANDGGALIKVQIAQKRAYFRVTGQKNDVRGIDASLVKELQPTFANATCSGTDGFEGS
jgi:hypothetical protein